MKDLYFKNIFPFAPTGYTVPARLRSAYLLYIICWVWAIVVTVAITIMVFIMPAFLHRGINTVVTADLILTICLLLNWKGNFMPAAALFILGIWLIATSLALTAGGIASEAIVTYLPLIVAAGLLLGGIWGIATCFLCMCTVLVMVLLDMNGMLPPKMIVHTPFSLWMGYSISGILIAGMQYVASRQVDFMVGQLMQEVADRKKTEVLLNKSEFNNQLVIENKILGIAWASPDGRILNASPTFCEMLGYTVGELKGVYFGDITYPDDTAAELMLIQKIDNRETDNYTIEKRYKHKNGDYFWVELCLTCYRNAETGEIDFFVGIVQNIQKRKTAELETRKSEAKYRSLIEQASDAIMITDFKGNFLDANIAMCAMFGYTREELLQTNISALIDAEQLKTDPIRFDLLSAGVPMMKERRMIHKNGTVIGVEANVKLTPDNNLLAIARDITEKLEARKAITALNESLEKKVAERTAELQDANRELEAFNYSVSHDLQSPLRVVNGFAQILLKDYEDKLDNDAKHLLQSINGNVARMNQLIRDLLEFSKSGRAVIAKQQVNMNGVVNSIIDEVKMGRENFTTEIIVRDMETAVSDANLIRQVWANLILNAVKFSGKKEKPVVEIGNQLNNGEVIYYVKDNGAGFDMQHAHKLFGAFQRMHLNAEFEGTGVGLATSDRIITRHGGKIWAEAKPDEGATFYFTVPVGES